MMNKRKSNFAFVFLLLATASFFSTALVAAEKKSAKESLQGLSNKINNKSQKISNKNREAVDASLESIAKAKEEITPEQEYYIGRAVAAKVLDKYKLYNNAKVTTYVNNICKAITSASSMPELYSDYCVGVLDSSEINAISSPGGHILVTRGLIECAETEDQLAAVIAHEVAHIQLKHSSKAIKSQRTVNAIKSTASAAATVGSMGKDSAYTEGADEIVTTITSTGYSKKQEYEADQKAASLMADAGYNPNALMDMLKVLEKRESGQSAGMVKTHPSAKSRQSNARGYVRSAGYGKDFHEDKRVARFKSVQNLL